MHDGHAGRREVVDRQVHVHRHETDPGEHDSHHDEEDRDGPGALRVAEQSAVDEQRPHVVADVDRERRDEESAGDQRPVEDDTRDGVECAQRLKCSSHQSGIGGGHHRGEHPDQHERHEQRRHPLRRHPRRRGVGEVRRETEGDRQESGGPEGHHRQSDEGQSEDVVEGEGGEHRQDRVHHHDRDGVDGELPRRQCEPPLLSGGVPRAPVADAGRCGRDDPGRYGGELAEGAIARKRKARPDVGGDQSDDEAEDAAGRAVEGPRP